LPVAVEKCVRSRLKDSSFGKGMDSEKRTSLAYARCWEDFKKRNEANPEEFFDGFLTMGLLPGAFFSPTELSELNVEKFAKKRKKKDRTEATYEALEKFKKIQPIDTNSLMFIAQIQSDALFREEPHYEIDEEAIDNALPIFNSEMFNNLFSSHRYADEFNIGTIRMADVGSRLALCEIFTGNDSPQGSIVANNIRTKRTKAVSSGMMILEKTCGICNAVGKPYLDCGHWAGETYDGKLATIRINKIQYFDLSTVSMPRDRHALILIHHDSDRSLKSSDNKVGSTKLIKPEEVEITQLTQSQEVMKPMSEQTDENKEQKLDVKELLSQISDLTTMNKQLLSDKNNMDTRLSLIEKQNEALANFIEQKNADEKSKIIEEAIQLQLQASMIDPKEIEKARNHLMSLSPEQLKNTIKSAQRVISLIAGKTYQSTDSGQPTNADVPKSVEFNLGVKNIEALLYNSRMGKFVKRIDKKAEFFQKKIEGVQNQFEPITDEDRYAGQGHITIDHNSPAGGH
jgi:hypothetical protein